MPGTVQIASQMPHCTKFTAAFSSSASSSSVMMDEVIEENRLARSQRSAGCASQPVRGRLEGRGASAVVAMAQRSTSAICALYQFMNRLMPRLMVKNTAMISAIASIAWPVWFSVVLAIDTMSW